MNELIRVFNYFSGSGRNKEQSTKQVSLVVTFPRLFPLVLMLIHRFSRSSLLNFVSVLIILYPPFDMGLLLNEEST